MIPKGNKPTTEPANYRPSISLLEVPGKILEKIIHQRLRTDLELNTILPTTPHGFRSNRGTDTALALTTEKIAHAAGNNMRCCVVLRDVSKAFDKVWHYGLKYKLNNIGLPLIVSKILCNFLDNRTAQIALTNAIGPPFPINSGVPQGSSISPSLYALYTHDLAAAAAAPGCLSTMHADDITQIITYPGKSKRMIAKKVENEIIKINGYEKKWKIKTNTNKFTIIPIAMQNPHPISINQEIIPYSNNGTILAMEISNRGIRSHITQMKNVASTALAQLRRFYKLKTRIKTHLIKACIIPKLTYPSYPPNASSKTAMQSLQHVQNKALRFAFSEIYPYTKTTEEMHLEAKLNPIITTLYNRGNQTKGKMINELSDVHYTELMTFNNENPKNHQWFRRPHLTLNKDPPEPIYTKADLLNI